jgi:multiple antibiotic resistance protein
MIQEILNSLALIFAGLFPIINPPGTSLIFYSMTRRASRAERAELARRIALYAFLILNASLYFGAYVLVIFGISVPILRVAGGIVVTLMGWKLLNAADSEQADLEKPAKGEGLIKASFYPLTMPLTTGPGSIAATIALGAGRTGTGEQWLSFGIGASLATILISGLVYVCYRFADRVERALGETASDAIARLFAFILMCIGIAIFWAGFSELVLELKQS